MADVPVSGRRFRSGEHHASQEIPAEDHDGSRRHRFPLPGHRLAKPRRSGRRSRRRSCRLPRRRSSLPVTARIRAEDAETLRGSEGGKVDIGEARGLAEHHDSSRRHRLRRRRAVSLNAPTIRSSKPSPLTSPADETRPARPDRPRRAEDAEALRVAVEMRRDVDVGEARRLAEHHIASPASLAAVAVAQGAPTIRSSKPSPLTSPAEETRPARLVARIARRRC